MNIEQMIELVEAGHDAGDVVDQDITGLERRLRKFDQDKFGRPGLWGNTKKQVRDFYRRHKYSITAVGVPVTLAALYGARAGIIRSTNKRIAKVASGAAREVSADVLKSPEMKELASKLLKSSLKDVIHDPEIGRDLTDLTRRTGKQAVSNTLDVRLSGGRRVERIRAWIQRKYGV